MSDNDRIVYRTEDGKWANKKVSGDRVSSNHDTQKEAEDTARHQIKSDGGGELITKGLDGKIRSKDTIAPGNESSKKDTEH